MAIDRRQITDQVTGAGELPAYSWVPPGIPGLCARAVRLGDAAGTAHARSGRSELWTRGPQTRRRAGAADALHRRQRQSPPHGRRARRPMATGARCRGGHRRDGMEGLPRHARAARRMRPDALRLVGRLRRPGGVPRALHVGPRAERRRAISNPAYDALLAKAARLPTDAGQRAALLARAEQMLLAGRRRHSGVPSRLEAPGEARHRRRRRQSAGSPALALPATAANQKNRAGGLRHPAQGVDRRGPGFCQFRIVLRIRCRDGRGNGLHLGRGQRRERSPCRPCCRRSRPGSSLRHASCG